MSVVFVTHDLSVARVVADRIAVMYLGRIVEIGPADEVIGNPAHPYTQALVDSIPDLGRESRVLPGEPASPLSPPTGCAFHPRCPISDRRLQRTANSTCAWRATPGNPHQVACIETAGGLMAIALSGAGTGARARQRRILSLPQSRSTVFNWLGFSLVIVVTVVAIAVPLLAPHDPLLPVGMPLQAPGKNGFLLGTDSIGRDILSRVLYGARSSWFAALVVVAVGLLFGGLVGLIAGATGGWVDSLLMRITDGFLSLPAPVLAIAVVAALGPGFVHTLIAVSIVWWPFYARLVRGEVARLAARPHVEAAKLAGVEPDSACRAAPAARCGAQCAGRRQPRHRHADPDTGGAVVPRPRPVRARRRSWVPTPPAT